MPREREFYINGYWLDTNETINGAKCAVGEYQEDEYDDDIFYWFYDDVEVMGFMKENAMDRNDTEFVITEIY